MAILRLGKNGQMVLYCRYEDKNIAKKVAGWNNSKKCWTFPCTVEKVEYLSSKIDCLEISSEAQERIEQQRDAEEKLQKLKRISKQDKLVQFKVPGIKLALYNYQKLGVMFALANFDGILLADEMGLGKSVQAIAVACYKKYEYGIDRCLVIVPASLKWNWPLEIEKFSNEPYVVIDGSPDKREKQWLRDDVFFYIVNYELVLEDLFGGRTFKIKDDDSPETIRKKEKQKKASKERAERLVSVRKRVWPMIVIDEAHAIKSHSAKRTRNVKQLKSQYRMALTGTPMDGRLEELHSVIQFVIPDLLESKTRFLQKHAEFDFWGRITKYKGIAEVKSLIDNFFMRRLKKDVLEDLPDKIYENRYITLTPQELKTYKELADRGHEITEDVEAMVAVIRCKQFCDHPQLIELDAKKTPSKLQALIDVLEELVIQNANKVIIFSQYATMNEIIIEELKRMGLKYLYIWGETPKRERAEMQEMFNTDPSIDVIIGTDAMSLGFNFIAANYVVNYDDAWSPSIMSQREDRAHRIGQKEVVTVVNFVCRNTIEERIRDVLYGKSVVSAETLGDETDEMTLHRLGPQDIAKLL